jgi:hypothetical protein
MQQVSLCINLGFVVLVQPQRVADGVLQLVAEGRRLHLVGQALAEPDDCRFRIAMPMSEIAAVSSTVQRIPARVKDLGILISS